MRFVIALFVASIAPGLALAQSSSQSNLTPTQRCEANSQTCIRNCTGTNAQACMNNCFAARAQCIQNPSTATQPRR